MLAFIPNFERIRFERKKISKNDKISRKKDDLV